jgi:hypothetical protein
LLLLSMMKLQRFVFLSEVKGSQQR